jgi:hypothetical protein
MSKVLAASALSILGSALSATALVSMQFAAPATAKGPVELALGVFMCGVVSTLAYTFHQALKLERRSLAIRASLSNGLGMECGIERKSLKFRQKATQY